MGLIEIYNKYSTQKDCILLLEQLVWNSKPACPHCGYEKYSPV